MNVLFHVSTAVGVAALLTDTTVIEKLKSFKSVLRNGSIVFIASVLSHGILDYIPHCYPVDSKVDTITALFIMIAFTAFARKPYRIIIGLSFIGSIFPDLVDLAPAILNKLTGIALPVYEKIFPWHWHTYSGSIYNGECSASSINHALVLLTVLLICLFKRKNLKRMFVESNIKK